MTEGVLTSGEVTQLRKADFTYTGVGFTRDDTMPNGYNVLRRSLEIGFETERFDQAAKVLLDWGMHRRARLLVRTSHEQVAPGAVALIRLGVGIFSISAPVRVVYVIDEPQRVGFAYGTLSGHPESGEEAFIVELQEKGAVKFSITAFSRPASLLARTGGPLTRATQSWITGRYLRAV